MSDQMLKDWAWRLERAIHSGHHCDATIAADAVMQSIKAELKRRATAAPVVVGEDMSQSLREAIAIVAKAEGGKWLVDRASPPYETTGVSTEYRKAVCEIEYGGGFGSRSNSPEWLTAQAEAIVAAVNFIREHGESMTAALAGEGK